MSTSLISFVFLFFFALVIAAVMVIGSAYIGRRKGPKTQLVPYECGLDPLGEPRRRLPLKFFLIAVLFIIFDIEVVFLYPWAVVFRDFVASGHGLLVFLEMMVFMGILGIGFAYIWGRGALEWEDGR